MTDRGDAPARTDGDFAATAGSEDLEIEVLGAVDARRLRAAAAATLAALGRLGGHVAIELVTTERIAELNRRYRGIAGATDVLAFPIDGECDVPGAAAAGPSPAHSGPVELGDVVICPDLCTDLVETVVHGVLHLCGFDHEVDDGEMFEFQDRVVERLRSS